MLTAGCVPGSNSTGATLDTTATTMVNGTDSVGTTSASTTSTPLTTGPANTSSATNTTNESSDASSAMCSFLDCTESSSGGPAKECDPWVQDCPDGQKCMPWANDGGNAWNATRCTDVMPNAGKPGDECTAEGNGVSGIDSCEKAALCWGINVDTGKGYCAPFCKGPPETPTCPGGTICVIGADSIPILCLPGCDPLQQNCSSGELCVPETMGDGFQCILDTSGDMGQQNDPCESSSACNPGLVCLPSNYATECDPMAAGCCLPFCDLNMPDCTNQGSSCVGWYEPGMEPPGLGLVGICRTP
jgi:hypothetical protein